MLGFKNRWMFAMNIAATVGCVVAGLALPFAAGAEISLVIRNGAVFDGTGTKFVDDQIIAIAESKIVYVGGKSGLDALVIASDADEIDARGKWIIPGLIDSHIHLHESGSAFAKPELLDLTSLQSAGEEMALIATETKQYLAAYPCAGVTAMVEMGGPVWAMEAGNGLRFSPGMPFWVSSGEILTNQIPDGASWSDADPGFVVLEEDTDVTQIVARQLKAGAGVIKILLADRSPVSDVFASQIRQAVEVAHKYDRQVVAHALRLGGAKIAVSAGVDVLAHGVIDRPLDDELLGMMKARDVIYTSSLSAFENYVGAYNTERSWTELEKRCALPRAIQSFERLSALEGDAQPRMPPTVSLIKFGLEQLRENLMLAHAAGIRIAAGTDAGNVGTFHGTAIHAEMISMRQAGMMPADILIAATANSTRVIDRTPEAGELIPGKYANLVILNSNPLAAIENTQDIEAVIMSGRQVER